MFRIMGSETPLFEMSLPAWALVPVQARGLRRMCAIVLRGSFAPR